MSRILDVARRMAEMRAEQNTRAAAASAFAGIPLDELRAIRKLATDTWGAQATIFADPTHPGKLSIGFFNTTADRHLPPHQRAETIVARGRTHAELLSQVNLWRKHT